MALLKSVHFTCLRILDQYLTEKFVNPCVENKNRIVNYTT